jgi:hypothetical protein
MSYSINLPRVAKTTPPAATGAAITGYDPPGPAPAETRDHLAALAQAVPLIVAAIGRDHDDVDVHITGHANPRHAPTEGWADEHVTVTIAYARPPTEATEATEATERTENAA